MFGKCRDISCRFVRDALTNYDISQSAATIRQYSAIVVHRRDISCRFVCNAVQSALRIVYEFLIKFFHDIFPYFVFLLIQIQNYKSVVHDFPFVLFLL